MFRELRRKKNAVTDETAKELLKNANKINRLTKNDTFRRKNQMT